MPIATSSIARIASVSQVGTRPDSSSAARGSVVGESVGVVVDGAGADVSLGEVVAVVEDGAEGLDGGRSVVAGPLGSAVADALGADSVGVAVGVVEADDVADGVGVVVGVRAGGGVGFFVGDGVGFSLGLGAACTGAATAGVRRAAPCCQARATAPPSGTSRDVTASLE